VHPKPLSPYLLRISSARPIVSGGFSFCVKCYFYDAMGFFRNNYDTVSHNGTVPYRSSVQMSCRKEVGVSFVALGI
jgi:hypothetical protein